MQICSILTFAHPSVHFDEIRDDGKTLVKNRRMTFNGK